MFDCPDLESELLAGIQDLASKPLAELLLQHGILRSMAQENLLRQLREGVSFTREEEPIIIERLWEGVEGEAPSSLAGDWIANLPDPLKLGMGQRWDQVRLQKLMETRYQDRVEPYFLERRKELEQVVYGLIRLHNQGAAEELYLRLINDGDDFSELAKEHSLGEERFTHGLVGPMLISQPHPTIRAVLESLKVGEVHAPFRVDSWVLLVLLEHRQPARLNDATRIQLLQELLQQEVDETLDPLLATTYESLVPKLGPAPQPTLPPAPPLTLVISSDTAALAADQVATITFSFSEPPLGFSLEQIIATGGLIPELLATDDPAVYTGLFTPAANSSGLAEISVAAGSYTNAAGLLGEAAALAAIPYDTLPPAALPAPPPAPPLTLVISSDTAALAADQVATITFSFSEPPLGFSLEQIIATGGLIPELLATDDPAVYTGLFTPAANSSGLAEISVAAGSYTNAAGLLGEAAALAAIPYDTLPPAPPPTLAIGADFEVTTIEAGISDGFKANSASLNEQGDSNDLGSKFNGDGLTDLIGTPPLGDSADISDARSTVVFFGKASQVGEFAPVANNNNSSLTSVAPSYPTNSLAQSGAAFTLAALTYKTLAPIVSISSDSTSLVAGQVAAMTFGFSEVPIGFTLNSIDASGGLISNLEVTTDPTVYTAIFTPTPDSSGIAVISVASGFYTNWAGQAGASAFSSDITYNTMAPAISVVPECTTNPAGQNDAASRSPDVSFHTLAPIVFISSNSGRLLAGKVATITFGFSEAPIGFTLDSIHASGGLISNLEVTTDPTVYTAIFTPTPDSSGIAVISVTAGSYSNLAGQAGGASFSADIPFDTMATPAGKPPESFNQAA